MGLYAPEMENARDPEQGKGMENARVMQDILQIIALNAHKDTSTRMQVGYRRLICARLYVPRKNDIFSLTNMKCFHLSSLF